MFSVFTSHFAMIFHHYDFRYPLPPLSLRAKWNMNKISADTPHSLVVEHKSLKLKVCADFCTLRYHSFSLLLPPPVNTVRSCLVNKIYFRNALC